MKLITVPVDFSEYSENAISITLLIAKSYKAKIHFVRCTESNEKENSVTSSKINGIVQKANQLEIIAESFVENGLPAHKAITNHVKEYNSNLIIMGSHDLTTIPRYKCSTYSSPLFLPSPFGEEEAGKL